ncbi:hypothetical protein [Chloroflexus sp. Y-396-1]|uniref:hypothetical protein n=1 Tax=Chloroflexus sp. Y-396-1 TaxID=867845 RepID=UPI0012EC54B0|nr:hypothetical protein [Chloroflexus sp. Y-396-1]
MDTTTPNQTDGRVQQRCAPTDLLLQQMRSDRRSRDHRRGYRQGRGIASALLANRIASIAEVHLL